MTSDIHMDELVELRRYIHSFPEVSGKEVNTARTIKGFLEKYPPDEMIEGIGGEGVLLRYDGEDDGPGVLFRAELDALPIQEKTGLSYASSRQGNAHLCGHDGHMSILIGLARSFSEDRPKSGTAWLIFQPAEETGEGAKQVLQDQKFDIQPDFVFALHNLPGYPLGKVLYRDGSFTMAVHTVTLRINGHTSHAAEPELGRSPVPVIREMLDFAGSMENRNVSDDGFQLFTPVHVQVAEKAFGTSPGVGEISITIRCRSNERMQDLEVKTEQMAKSLADKHNVEVDIEWSEHFAACENDRSAVEHLKNAVDKARVEMEAIDNPFRWGEDFGLFTKAFKGCLFGLGSGKDQPSLHHPKYDFPDELINPGVELFMSIYDTIQEKR